MIPLVLQVEAGKRKKISIFGDGFETRDGTCIRDFIHFQDLCEVHILSLKRLLKGGDGGSYNLGNGRGFSVLEVIDSAKKDKKRKDCCRDRSSQTG